MNESSICAAERETASVKSYCYLFFIRKPRECVVLCAVQWMKWNKYEKGSLYGSHDSLYLFSMANFFHHTTHMNFFHLQTIVELKWKVKAQKKVKKKIQWEHKEKFMTK